MKATVKPARRSERAQSIHSHRPIRTQLLGHSGRKRKDRTLRSAGDEGEDEDVKVALGGVISKLFVLNLWYTYLHAATPDLERTVDLENSFIQ